MPLDTEKSSPAVMCAVEALFTAIVRQWDESGANHDCFRVGDLRRRSFLPDLPWGLPIVQFFEGLFVLKSIHALPEASALIGQQGALFNQPLKWLSHQFI